MANFLFVYRGGGDAEAKMTPDEMQQMMQKWGAWIGEAMAKGWMVNPGDALTMEGRVVNARKVVTDGPFVESKEIVGGYSIVQADTIDAAAELAKGCPALLYRRYSRGSDAGRIGGTALTSLATPPSTCGTTDVHGTTRTGRSSRGAFLPPRGGATGRRVDPLVRLAELRSRRGDGAGHLARCAPIVARFEASPTTRPPGSIASPRTRFSIRSGEPKSRAG